jgi:uncharacterized protein (TIGR00369 family)
MNVSQITPKFLDRINQNPLYQTLGIRIAEADGGKARSHLEPQVRVCWPFYGQPHGGVLFTLMDTTMAWAIQSRLDPGYSCTTVNLDIQYTLPAKGQRFDCEAWITHRSGRLNFIRAEIRGSQGELLAMGQATFRTIQSDVLDFSEAADTH